MTEELRAKLREILNETIPGDHAVYFEPYEEAIAQILEMLKDRGFMTSQEWFAKFETNFLGVEFVTGGLGYIDAAEVKEKVLEVAKKVEE